MQIDFEPRSARSIEAYLCYPPDLILRCVASALVTPARRVRQESACIQRHAMRAILESYEFTSSEWSFCLRMASSSLGSASPLPKACAT